MADAHSSESPAPGGLLIERHQQDGKLVIDLRGELDLTSAPVFERELESVESASPGSLVIDVSGLEFMDSTGLRALLTVRDRAQANGLELVLRRPTRQVHRVLELTGMLERFSFED